MTNPVDSTHFEKQTHDVKGLIVRAKAAKENVLSLLLGQADRFRPLVVTLDAKKAAWDEALELHQAANDRIEAMEQKWVDEAAAHESATADYRKARTEALIRGAALPKVPKAPENLAELQADIDGLKGALPELESAVSQAHIAWSLAFQALRREAHQVLNEELAHRARALDALATAVQSLRSGAMNDRCLHPDAKALRGSESPCGLDGDAVEFHQGMGGEAMRMHIPVRAEGALRLDAEWITGEFAQALRSNPEAE